MSNGDKVVVRSPAGAWAKIWALAGGAFCSTMAGVLTVAARPWVKEDLFLASLFALASGFATFASGVFVRRPDDVRPWNGKERRNGGGSS